MSHATVQVGPWIVRAQPDLTRSAYARVHSAGPERCDCIYCRNWVAAREQACPPAYRQLLERLGADWRLEDEVVHCARVADGHRYGGWLWIVGEMIDGPKVYVPHSSGQGFEIRLQPLEGSLSVGVSARRPLSPRAPDAFAGLPLLEFQFEITAPWVLTEPDPDFFAQA
jgi:hypothetical protein